MRLSLQLISHSNVTDNNRNVAWCFAIRLAKNETLVLIWCVCVCTDCQSVSWDLQSGNYSSLLKNSSRSKCTLNYYRAKCFEQAGKSEFHHHHHPPCNNPLWPFLSLPLSRWRPSGGSQSGCARFAVYLLKVRRYKGDT